MVVLRHADGDVGFPELAHIQVAAVLYAPVRMVDQPFGIVPTRLCDGRPEGFQREEGAERGGKRPACYLVGMAVGHQMQAAASPVRVDVGYAAYPQTVCRIRDAVLYQVFPFVVTVVGVGGMPTAGRLSEQLVTRRSFRKASRSDIRPRPNRSHCISHSLQPPMPGSDRAHLGDGAEDAGLPAEKFLTVRLLLVIGLSAMAKQFAGGLDVQAVPLAKSGYCSGPVFFRI